MPYLRAKQYQNGAELRRTADNAARLNALGSLEADQLTTSYTPTRWVVLSALCNSLGCKASSRNRISAGTTDSFEKRS